jgi:hypothetical protein
VANTTLPEETLNMFNFLQKIYDFMVDSAEAIDNASREIYAQQVEQYAILDYMGYFRTVVGDFNYWTFTTILLIGAVFGLVMFFLRGFDLIKPLLPW